MQTAAQLFLEKSYGRTSMNDVAERLNITKPALYHYFHNKEEILLECYRLGTGMIEEILNEIAAHCGTGLEKVEAFIYSYANVMTVNFGRCVMRFDEGDLSSEAFAEVRAYKRKIDRRLRGVYTRGDRGRIDHAVRSQDGGIFHRRRSQLDLHLVRAERPAIGRGNRDPIRADADAGSGDPAAAERFALECKGVFR